MAMEMSSREKMLRRVQMYGFAMNDAALFLDSHPNSREGLDYYRKQKALYDKSASEFAAKYGPLEKSSIPSDADNWDWVSDPWPWEYDQSGSSRCGCGADDSNNSTNTAESDEMGYPIADTVFTEAIAVDDGMDK